MATLTRTLPPIIAKELIALQEFITIPTYLIEELKDKPYSKLCAYIDILNMAEEGGGEFETTRRTLENRWGWSGNKVNNFLSMLEEKTIIEPKKNQKRTKIKLVNSMVLDIQETKKEPKKNQKRANEKEEDIEIYKRIIDHLNMVCGTRYKHTTAGNVKDLKARLKEEYTEEDFYTVIDKKAKEWLGTECEKYLRPSTLFGNKFGEYLNQNIVKRKGQTAQMLENHYDMVSEWARKKKMQEGYNDG